MSLPYLARVGQRADLALGTPGVVSSAHAQQFSIVVIAPTRRHRGATTPFPRHRPRTLG